MTPFSSPVTYTIETYNETIATGIVTNSTLANVNMSSNLAVIDSSYQNRNKGIHVSADSEISVLLINYQPGSIGDYLAYPVQNLNLAQYQYYIASTGIGVFIVNKILLVSTEDNTTVTVVPTQNISVPQNIQLPKQS